MSIFPTKILLATDGSSEAQLAARTAVDLSQKTDSELHLIHVLDVAKVGLSMAVLYSEATDPEGVKLPDPGPGGGTRTAGKGGGQGGTRRGSARGTFGRWDGRTVASEDGRGRTRDRPPSGGCRGRTDSDGQQGARWDKQNSNGQCLRFGGSPCPLSGAGSPRMKDDADQIHCHPSRRGGSEHQLGEGSPLPDSVRPRSWVLPLMNIERTARTVPRSPGGMPILACWKLTACPGKARLCGYGTQCLLCGEASMRHSRANLAKGTIRFLRQREIGG